MTWYHFPPQKGACEMWQLNITNQSPVRGINGDLYIINYKNHMWDHPPGPDAMQGWCVHPRGVYEPIAVLPFDTPVEELKALAIAEWRLT